MATWQVRVFRNPENVADVVPGHHPFVIYRQAANGDLFVMAFTKRGLIERKWTPGQPVPVHIASKALCNWQLVDPPAQFDLDAPTDTDTGER